MLILNEKKYAESLYNGINDNIKSVVAKVGYITRYFCDRGDSDNENYSNTVNWMNNNHENFDESCYSKLISDAIRKAHKKPFFHIDNIIVTKSELETISSLNNLRAEKVLFVLLCMAKQQRVVYGFTNGLVNYSLPDLCKMARISVPTSDREYILYEIVQSGCLSYPKKNDTSCLMVNFIDDDSDVELVINEMDCQELAYVYLNWKNGGGYIRCEFCGRLVRQTKKENKRFCRECTEIVGNVPDGMKVVVCCDCGQITYVDSRNMTKCRCDDCQHEHRKEWDRERKNKQKHEKSTFVFKS